ETGSGPGDRANHGPTERRSRPKLVRSRSAHESQTEWWVASGSANSRRSWSTCARERRRQRVGASGCSEMAEWKMVGPGSAPVHHRSPVVQPRPSGAPDEGCPAPKFAAAAPPGSAGPRPSWSGLVMFVIEPPLRRNTFARRHLHRERVAGPATRAESGADLG